MLTMVYLVAFISILLGSMAQYLLKRGVTAADIPDCNGAGVIARLAATPDFWLGLLSYGLSMVFWLYVLSHLELSRAYPLVSIGYILTLIIGYLFLNEPLTIGKIIGSILIVVGVVFISKG